MPPTSPRSDRSKPASKQLPVEVIKIVVGGAVGVVLAFALLWFGFGRDPLSLFGGNSKVAESEPVVEPRQPSENSDLGKMGSAAPTTPDIPAADPAPLSDGDDPAPDGSPTDTTADSDRGFTTAATAAGVLRVKARPALTGHEGPIVAVSVSTDSLYAITASTDKLIVAWDAKKGTSGTTERGFCRSLAFSRGGGLLAGAVDDAITLWDLTPAADVRRLQAKKGAVAAVAFSPRSDVLAAAEEDGVLRFWDTSLLKEFRQVEFNSRPHGIAYSPQGNVIAVACDEGVQMISSTGEIGVVLRGHVGSVHAISFNSSGEKLASTGADGNLLIWDLDTPTEPLRRIEAHQGGANAVSWRPQSELVVSGGDDKMVCLWSATSGKKLGNITAHKGPIRGVAFSPNGEFFVTGADDAVAAVWEVQLDR